MIAFEFAGHSRSATAVAIGSTGGFALTAGFDGAIRRWFCDGAGTWTLDDVPIAEGLGKLTALALFPDDRRTLSAGYDGAWRIFDLDRRECVAHVRAHNSRVLAVAMSPVDGRFITADAAGVALLWQDAESPPISLPGPTDAIWAVTFAADLPLVFAACADGTSFLWVLKHESNDTIGSESRTHDGPVTAAVFVPVTQGFVSAGRDGSIRVGPGILANAMAGGIESLAISADARTLAVGTSAGAARIFAVDPERHFTPTSTPNPLPPPILETAPRNTAILSLAFVPGQNQILAACADGHLRVIEW